MLVRDQLLRLTLRHCPLVVPIPVPTHALQGTKFLQVLRYMPGFLLTQSWLRNFCSHWLRVPAALWQGTMAASQPVALPLAAGPASTFEASAAKTSNVLGQKLPKNVKIMVFFNPQYFTHQIWFLWKVNSKQIKGQRLETFRNSLFLAEMKERIMISIKKNYSLALITQL